MSPIDHVAKDSSAPACEVVSKDPKALSGLLSRADRNALNAWFKGNGSPNAVSTEGLKVYREIAEQAINNPDKATDVGKMVQTDRLRMIIEELNRR